MIHRDFIEIQVDYTVNILENVPGPNDVEEKNRYENVLSEKRLTTKSVKQTRDVPKNRKKPLNVIFAWRVRTPCESSGEAANQRFRIIFIVKQNLKTTFWRPWIPNCISSLTWLKKIKVHLWTEAVELLGSSPALHQSLRVSSRHNMRIWKSCLKNGGKCVDEVFIWRYVCVWHMGVFFKSFPAWFVRIYNLRILRTHRSHPATDMEDP